jgi:hypothetical protein
MSQVEKFCPESCCVVGNHYSLKGKHERAVLYFQRAIKLNSRYALHCLHTRACALIFASTVCYSPVAAVLL